MPGTRVRWLKRCTVSTQLQILTVERPPKFKTSPEEVELDIRLILRESWFNLRVGLERRPVCPPAWSVFCLVQLAWLDIVEKAGVEKFRRFSDFDGAEIAWRQPAFGRVDGSFCGSPRFGELDVEVFGDFVIDLVELWRKDSLGATFWMVCYARALPISECFFSLSQWLFRHGFTPALRQLVLPNPACDCKISLE